MAAVGAFGVRRRTLAAFGASDPRAASAVGREPAPLAIGSAGLVAIALGATVRRAEPARLGGAQVDGLAAVQVIGADDSAPVVAWGGGTVGVAAFWRRKYSGNQGGSEEETGELYVVVSGGL